MTAPDDKRAPLSAAERERYVRSLSEALDMFALYTETCDDSPDPCIAHDAQDRFRALLDEHDALKAELAREAGERAKAQNNAALWKRTADDLRAERDALKAELADTKAYARGLETACAGLRRDLAEARAQLETLIADVAAACHATGGGVRARIERILEAAQQQPAPSAPPTAEPRADDAYRAKVEALCKAIDARDIVLLPDWEQRMRIARNALLTEHPADEESDHG